MTLVVLAALLLAAFMVVDAYLRLRAAALELDMPVSFLIESRLTERFGVEEINGDGKCPTYLYRWTLGKLGPWKAYLHKFVGDDWALDLHDHPKRFVSIGLVGGYSEWTRALGHDFMPDRMRQLGPRCGASFVDAASHPKALRTTFCGESEAAHRHVQTFRAPWVRTFSAEHAHRLTGPTPERPCWTLVIVGAPVRDWGFWVRNRWVNFRDYVHGPDGEAGKACP